MRLPRMQFTLRLMMIAVALVALLLGALRGGYYAYAGILIIAICISCLIYLLSADILTLRKAKGIAINRSQRAMVVLDSTARATAITLASVFVFLAVNWFYLYFVLILAARTNNYPYREPVHITTGTVLGVFASISVASRMRRIIREDEDLLYAVQSTSHFDRCSRNRND